MALLPKPVVNLSLAVCHSTQRETSSWLNQSMLENQAAVIDVHLAAVERLSSHQLTCATVKGPNEQARMARRDRPRGGAVRIHQNLGTPSVTMETAERVGVCGMGGRQVDPPHQLP
ncbi:unnamed protein product [Leuciscus chuanchicus]